MGKVLKILGVVFLVVIILAIGTGIYFYNFHVFKTVRICVGEGVDSGLFCGSGQDCLGRVEGEVDASLDGAPDFVRENFEAVLGESIYCDETCFVREIRGLDYETGEVVWLDSCESDETEFVVEIRGKEGIEILKWMSARE